MEDNMLLMTPIGIRTPLHFLVDISRSISTYAGVCIILSVLAIVFRFLVAFKSVLERHRINIEIKRRHFIHVRKPSIDTRINHVTSMGKVKGDAILVRGAIYGVRSWRSTFDGPRAAIDSLIVSTLYLLMLFLVTMDVGYLLSTLCGAVLGSVVVRKYSDEAISRKTKLFVLAVAAIVLIVDL